MNLCLSLPKGTQKTLESLTRDNILYTAPTDIAINGNFTQGWVVICEKEIFSFEEHKLKLRLKISDIIEFKAEKQMGSGMLIANVNGIEQPFARYSTRHLSRYAYIARGVRLLIDSNPNRVESDELENTCPKCGRGMQGTLQCMYCDGKSKSAKLFISLIKPYAVPLMMITIIMLLGTIASLAFQFVQRGLIDNVIVPLTGTMWDIMKYLSIMILFTAVIITTSAVRYIMTARLGAEICSGLRSRVFAKIQRLSLSYLDKHKAGELLTRILYDTDNIRRFMAESFGGLFSMIITFVGALVLMLIMNWQLTLISMIFIPIIMGFTGLFWRQVNKIFYAQWRKKEKINARLQDVLSGIRIVKSYGRESSEKERFSFLNNDFTETQIRNETFWASFFPIMQLMFSLSTCLITFFGGREVLKVNMSVGELAQFSAYTGILYGPLGWMTFLPRQIMELLTSIQRINDVLGQPETMYTQKESEVKRLEGNITLQDVSFGYHSYEPVLEGIDLKVRKGEMIGIVGSSGAGKSTLINLIMRLYDVDEGHILVDGKDIKDIHPEHYHKSIGVVLQETFLFSGTVLDNIRFSNHDASVEEIIRATKIANAHDFICRMPDGYNTLIGEHGFNVSGGERQRIAIARAVLGNPAILILDEATSALDTENEYQIQEALERLIKGRTTFSIAHRLSTLRNADRILVIDKHKQAELGTHNELIRQKGIYYELVMAQLMNNKQQST